MSDYYNLEKAAEVLGKAPGELNRLRESGKIRAFRDGSAWKFRKEDIDNFLAEELRQKNSASSFDDEGLLTDDSDEEEKPTMMADTNSFNDLNLEITTNAENDGISLDGEDSDGIILGKGAADDDHRAGSSSIDLNDDDYDDDDYASGISILDDPSDLSGSNIDLASDSGISIDDSGLLGEVPSSQSGSGSGISILGEEDELQGAQPAGADKSDDDFDFELDPLPSESTPPPAPAPAPAAAGGDDDIFELQPVQDESGPSGGAGDTYGVAGDSPSSETKELDLDDDFELEPSAETQESESESSSQMLDLDLDMNDLGLNPAADAGAAPAGIDLSKPTDGDAPAGDSFDLGDASAADPFAQGGADQAGGEFGGGFGDGGFGDGGFGGDDPFAGGDFSGGDGESGGDMSSADFNPVSGGDAAWTAEGGAAAGSNGESVAETQAKPIDFNGLGIGLGLVPCILLLILAGIGAWELVRSMWSWNQPFSLTGPVLEMIGNLLKLWK